MDLDFCAAAFELSGGNILSVAVSVAYLAAAAVRPVAMTDLVMGGHRVPQTRPPGRLCLDREFDPYRAMVI